MGTWGNIPGGETFIAPVEDSANGVFVLNGSFKGHVLQPATALRLHFRKGRLTDVDGPASVREAFDALLEPGRRRNDPFFDCLAELGIGVNPGIPELTGNALFDEKCDGTVHIAVGDSVRYGGRQASMLHEDLVTRHPSLWIDGRQVLDRGKNVFDPAVWRERLETTEAAGAVTAHDCGIRRTALRADFSVQGRLSVRREVTAGRICSYVIGDPETSRILALLYEVVPPLPASIGIADAVASAGLIQVPEALVLPGLTILLRHQMIRDSSPGGSTWMTRRRSGPRAPSSSTSSSAPISCGAVRSSPRRLGALRPRPEPPEARRRLLRAVRHPQVARAVQSITADQLAAAVSALVEITRTVRHEFVVWVVGGRVRALPQADSRDRRGPRHRRHRPSDHRCRLRGRQPADEAACARGRAGAQPGPPASVADTPATSRTVGAFSAARPSSTRR